VGAVAGPLVDKPGGGFIPIKLFIIIGNTIPLSGVVITGRAFFTAITAMSIFGNLVNRNCLPAREKR
jgi:hypothetical protein